jgi:hypothetical protein
MVGRYTHAHQFKRARRELKFLRTRLGRIIRDIRRQIEGDPALGSATVLIWFFLSETKPSQYLDQSDARLSPSGKRAHVD